MVPQAPRLFRRGGGRVVRRRSGGGGRIDVALAGDERLVDHMQQAARVADWTAFLYQGELVEYDRTEVLFTKPQSSKTEDYITGRFG